MDEMEGTAGPYHFFGSRLLIICCKDTRGAVGTMAAVAGGSAAAEEALALVVALFAVTREMR